MVFNRVTTIWKRLIFDLVRKNEDSCAHTTSDLEACCDRQLPNISGIVDESIVKIEKQYLRLKCYHVASTWLKLLIIQVKRVAVEWMTC